MRQLIAIILITLTAPISASGQPDFTGADFDVLPLGGSLYYLRNNSNVSNTSATASIGEDGVLLVDDTFGAMGDVLVKRLAALGGGDIRFVVNTHYHWDHTEANVTLGESATIIAHDKVRDYLSTMEMPANGEIMATSGWPVLTTSQSMTVHFNGDTVEIIAMPHGGHTGGDVVVYFRDAGVLCVGDYYFVDRWPIIDTQVGGSIDGYLANISMLADRFTDDTIVVPGHGHFPPTSIRKHTVGEMKKWAALVGESVDYIGKQKAAGVSLEALQDAGLPDKFAVFSERPRFVKTENWIAAVYGN